MTQLSRFFLPLLAVWILVSCANTSTSTLTINPTINLPFRDVTSTNATLNITSADQRLDSALAKVNRNGQLVRLMPSRDLRFLLQEVLEKQALARGYSINSQSDITVVVVINQLFANVEEGELRHTITVNTDVSIISQTTNGAQQSKHFRLTHSTKGAFSASNRDIEDVVNRALNDLIHEMSQDTSISDVIRQNNRA